MPTIKGPISFNKDNANDVYKKLVASGVEVKMPFSTSVPLVPLSVPIKPKVTVAAPHEEGSIPVAQPVPVAPVPEPPKIEAKPKHKSFTEQELKDMTKAEQVCLIKKFKGTEIPRFEKERIAYILKLQEQR